MGNFDRKRKGNGFGYTVFINMITSLINKCIEDIVLSGYTELEEIAHFSPMMWWVYLKLEDNSYILLSSNDGSISIENKEYIECNFDIEEEDLFTISSYSKSEYGTISKVDLFYDSNSNLISLGIEINKSKYLLFDSLDFDGFKIKEDVNRDDIRKNILFKTIKTINGK